MYAIRPSLSDTPLVFGSLGRTNAARVTDRAWSQIVMLQNGRLVALDLGLRRDELASILASHQLGRYVDYIALTHSHPDHLNTRTILDCVSQDRTKLCYPTTLSRDPALSRIRAKIAKFKIKHRVHVISEEQRTFPQDRLSIRNIPALHNGFAERSHCLVLEHENRTLLYATDLAEIPSMLYRTRPDAIIMEMNHPTPIKQRTSSKPLSNHLSNDRVANFFRMRRHLNRTLDSQGDPLKLFVAMHLAPTNTVLEVACTLARTFYDLPVRPVFAIRGRHDMWIFTFAKAHTDSGPAFLQGWKSSQALFGVSDRCVRVWFKGPLWPSYSSEQEIFKVDGENLERCEISVPPDFRMQIVSDRAHPIRFVLQPGERGCWEACDELRNEAERIYRAGPRKQALSALAH